MAKNDNVPNTQTLKATETTPVEAQKVEKQAERHTSATRNPYRALEAGRAFVAAKNLLGEIEKEIHQANAQTLAGLHAIHVKVGELLTKANEVDHPVAEKIKSFFLK